MSRLLRLLWLLSNQVVNVRGSILFLPRFFRFLAQFALYKRQTDETISFLDIFPVLNEATGTSQIDPHYYFVNGWAMRRITGKNPGTHVDIASQTIFSNLLAAVIPTIYIDYRPLNVSLSGLETRPGDIMKLDIASNSLESISCLHVIEHIGLGRYGDRICPTGTKQAAQELSRVLKPGGFLYVALPVGRERVCYNAHRVHSIGTVLSYFSELKLVEISGVTDSGEYIEHAKPEILDSCDYGCGFFIFSK